MGVSVGVTISFIDIGIVRARGIVYASYACTPPMHALWAVTRGIVRATVA